MRNLSGKVVALTGAGSGIGRALAVELVRQDASLALADFDEAGLKETADLCPDQGPKVTTHLVDVSRRDEVEAFARAVVDDHGTVDVIINNAGVGSVATFEEVDYEDLEWVLGVNLWGVIHGVKAFLPLLKRRPEAHIVNIGSVNSFLPFPTNGPYNISKFGVDALSKTLMQELAGTGITISCVYPGGVKTNASRNARHTTAQDHARFEGAASLSPDEAARRIIAGIKQDRRRIVVGVDAHLLAISHRLLPMTTLRMINWAARRPQSAGRRRNRA